MLFVPPSNKLTCLPRRQYRFGSIGLEMEHWTSYERSLTLCIYFRLEFPQPLVEYLRLKLHLTLMPMGLYMFQPKIRVQDVSSRVSALIYRTVRVR